MVHYSSLVDLLPKDLECHFFDSIESTNLFFPIDLLQIRYSYVLPANKLKEKDSMEDNGSRRKIVAFYFLSDVIFHKSATSMDSV